MSPALKALDYWKQSLKMATITDRIMHKLAAIDPNRVSDSSRAPQAAVFGMLGGSIAERGLRVGAGHVARKGLMDQGPPLSTKDILSRLRKVVPAAGLPVEEALSEGASVYVPKLPKYVKGLMRGISPMLADTVSSEKLRLPLKANPFITAHEVGHASGGRLSQTLMRHRIPITALSSLGGLGLLGHAAYTAEKGEGMGATGYAAPAVAAVAPALVQGEELRATLKARKLLNKAKIKVPGLGKLMRAQQLNYLLVNLGKVVPIGAGALALHHYLKPKDKGN